MGDLGMDGVEGAEAALANAFDAEQEAARDFGSVRRRTRLLGKVMALVRQQTEDALVARGPEQATAVVTLRRLEALAVAIAVSIRVHAPFIG
ncbi:MAG: hypothetical protein JWP01_3342 [Myxococcales bacterium]|nr:hypothetical protein [Myxococcales bacterium]